MNKLYVGVSGFARSGKNLFCDIAQKVLKEKIEFPQSQLFNTLPRQKSFNERKSISSRI